jgi:hypothetical protein
MNLALIKHFKLVESEVAEIQASLQPNQTLLDVLFDKKMVDPVAYLSWAKEHYSLPILKIEFLNQNDNVEALLDRYKNVFPKNVIPFHEIDGVLYVMCLEPTPFQAPQSIQYVLAPYEVIIKYASKNESTVSTVTPMEAEVPAEKENTNPLFKDLEMSKNPLESFSFDNLATPETPTAEGDASDVGNIKLEDKNDVPAGLDFPSTPTEEDSIVTNNPVKAVSLDSVSFVGIMPTEQKEPAAVSTPVAAPAQAPVPVPEAAPQPVIVKPSPTTFTPASANTIAAKPKPKTTPAEVPPQAIASPTPAPVPPPAPTPSVVPSMPSAAPSALSFEMPASVSPIGAKPAGNGGQFDQVLNSMKRYFDQSMVLMFTNGILEPKAWDSTWVKIPNTQLAVDLSTPSIFRIVNETLHPYHGYIVANQINDSFFGNWNRGQYPEYVTICPIVHDKKIYGMILGGTTKEGAKKYQLHHIQEIANEVFTILANSKAA